MGDPQLRTRGLQLNGVRLMATAIRETRRERDEAEWGGDLTKADRLSVELVELLRRYEAGEQYDPLF